MVDLTDTHLKTAPPPSNAPATNDAPIPYAPDKKKLKSSFALRGAVALVLWREAETDAVDAVPLVGGRVIALALEDVTEVAAAVGADDLGARHAKGPVLVARHGAGDAVVVGRPAATRAELVVGLVQGRLAPGAGVHARRGLVLVVLARAGGLGALLAEDAELLCCEGSALC